MTKEIRREIAFLRSQDPIMNHGLWTALIGVLEKMADRIDQLEYEKMIRSGI